jgi:predicted HD phosphohydrolase
MLAGQFPTIAAVFYHGAVELEGSNRARRAEILGATLAHEVGHLLMSDNRHSNAGILRAHWNDQDLKLISQGRMWFTTDQAERMVLLVAQRHRAAPTEVTMASGVETLTVTP